MKKERHNNNRGVKAPLKFYKMEEYNLKMIVFVLANYGFEKCLKVHNEVHENGEGSISSFDKHIGDDQGSSYYYNDSLHIGDYCCQAIDYIKEKNLKKND